MMQYDGRMDQVKKYQETLRKNRVYLVEQMKSDHLISHLLEESVLTPRDNAEFKALQTRRESSEWLIDHLSTHGPPNFYDVLRRALIKEGQEHVARKLDDTLTELMEEEKTKPQRGNRRRRSQSNGLDHFPPKRRSQPRDLHSPASSASSNSPRGSPVPKPAVNKACKYEEKGCCQSVPQDEYEAHCTTACPYRPQQCSECKEEVPLCEYGQHVRNCHARTIQCPVCPERVPQGMFDVHMSNHYDSQCVKCHFYWAGCTYTGKPSELIAHGKDAVCKHLVLQSRCCEKNRQGLQESLDSVKCYLGTVKKDHSVMKAKIQELSDKVNCPRSNSSPDAASAFIPYPTPESQPQVEAKTPEVVPENSGTAKARAKLFKPALEHVLALSNMTDNVVVGKSITFGEKDKMMKDEVFVDRTGEEECFQWDVYPVQRYFEAGYNEQYNSIVSPVFHTKNESGYKMQLQMYLNGDGEGNKGYVSLYYVLLPGKNDDQVDWPFTQQVTIRILDQSEQKRHITYQLHHDPETEIENPIPTEDSFVQYGIPRFVKYEFLNRKQSSYIHIDRMRVEVQVSSK